MESLSIQLNVSCAQKYPAKQHIQRVAQTLEASHGHIYLLGQYQALVEDSDMPRPFRQRRYFYYASGVDVPDCCLVYRIAQDELILYIPRIAPKKVMWMAQPPSIEEAKERYDVDDVRHNEDLFDDLREWLRPSKSKSQAQPSPFYVLHSTHKPEMELPGLNTDDLQPAMDKCRVIKDRYEIECIRKANAVTARAHRAVLRNMRNLTQERQIQGLVDYTFTVKLMEPAYATIAGSGTNASILHYTSNNELLEGRQLVCLDAGAQCENYASDVTRTFPISGYFSEEAREIYALVELMQMTCIEALKPGVLMWDLHQRCHRLVVEGFLRLGIFHNGTADEIHAAGTSNGFYPHGLGHHLGLETHDVIRRPILRYAPNGQVTRCEVPVPPARRARAREEHTVYKYLMETVLEPSGPAHPHLREGMVVTIEPGVYFNRYELQRAYLDTEPHCRYINRPVLERYWAVGGVRIEDDLLITKDGYENLTTAPKGNEALELIRTGPDCCDWPLD